MSKLAWHRGAVPMTIIDSQVHAYEANTPKRPWHSVPNWPDHVTGDEMVAAMDKVDVDGAIFLDDLTLADLAATVPMEVRPSVHFTDAGSRVMPRWWHINANTVPSKYAQISPSSEPGALSTITSLPFSKRKRATEVISTNISSPL
jgi:hypothetical protein